jgi:hypothetical protein
LYYWDDTAKELKPTGVTEAFWDSANKRLGIGTSSPASPLEVNGNIDVTNVTDMIGGVQKQNLLDKSASETISGEYTFSIFPITPSAAPDADYEVANKKYVDDLAERPTADGQLLFGDNGAGIWVHSETSEIAWDDTNKRLGIGVASPAVTLEVSHATDTQLVLSQTPGVDYANFDVTGSGHLSLTASGGKIGLGISARTYAPVNVVTVMSDDTSSVPTNNLLQGEDSGALYVSNINNSANYSGIGLRTRIAGAAAALMFLEHSGSSYIGDVVFKQRYTSGSSAETLRLAADSGGNVKVGVGGVSSPAGVLDINGEVMLREKSADPSNPAEGSFAMWMSDGTGSGDDGDIMLKITAGGTTKTVTLVDFSAA